MPARLRVLVTERIDRAGLDLLHAEADVVELYQAGGSLEERLAEADGIIVRISRIGEAQLNSARQLKVIGKHGIGVDNIDVDAATERGIPVVFTPGSNEEAVAEHTLMLMLMLARRVEEVSRLVRAGRFDDGRRAPPAIDLRGKTLGLLGIGRIGGRIATMCRAALEMPVLAYDPYAAPNRASALGVQLCESIDEVLHAADVVSIHAPLTPETRHLIDASRLRQMKPTAFLINCARGGLIDESALVDALASGTIAGAGIDVFAEEPPPPDHPLLSQPRCIVTPHVAGGSVEALRETARMVAEEVLIVLRGDSPRNAINRDALRSRRQR